MNMFFNGYSYGLYLPCCFGGEQMCAWLFSRTTGWYAGMNQAMMERRTSSIGHVPLIKENPLWVA